MNLSLKFRDQMVGDLGIVGEEFDQLFAALNARLPIGADGSILIGGSGGNKFQTIEVTEESHLKTVVKLDGQIEMLKGPWVFDVPNAGHIAVLRPPDPSGTYNNYTTQGLDSAIGVELEPTGATTITGISNPTRRKRLLFLRNRDSSLSITLKDNDAGSSAGNRFDFTGAAMVSGSSTHALLSASHNDTVVQTVSRGSLVYGNSTPAWDELTIGASGRLLRSNGIDVSWAQVILTTDVTGVLPAANGGIQIATLDITEAQLEALGTTPLTIVSAQGAGTVIVPLTWAIDLLIATAYTSSPLLRLRYNGQTADLCEALATGLATASGRYSHSANHANVNISYSGGATAPINTALEVSLATDPTGTGTATLRVMVWYVVATGWVGGD